MILWQELYSRAKKTPREVHYALDPADADSALGIASNN